MPLVSILIPCRNAAATLGETLASALAQRDVEKEIILVDDGSTDGSVQVAEQFASPQLKLVQGPRMNASAARNRAIEESTGDYLQFLDADDLLAPRKVKRQLEALAANPGAVAFGRWGRFQDDPAKAVFANDDQLRDWSPADWLVFLFTNNQMMHPAAWLVPRALAAAAGPWDESLTLNDDGEYFARVAAQAHALKSVPEAESYYRTLASPSLSKSRGRTAYASLFRSLRSVANVMLSLEDSPRTHRAAADTLKRFCFDVYPSARQERLEAMKLVERWGGSDVTPNLGPRGRALQRFLGWRLALIYARLVRNRVRGSRTSS